MGKIYLFVFFLYFLLSCQSFCGQTMAKGIFEEYYSQVAIIACVPKFSVQKAGKRCGQGDIVAFARTQAMLEERKITIKSSKKGFLKVKTCKKW